MQKSCRVRMRNLKIGKKYMMVQGHACLLVSYT